MYVVTGYLYKKDKLLLRGMWEDLENFVKRIVQLQHDIDDLTSCINIYQKDMDKAIKILGGKR